MKGERLFVAACGGLGLMAFSQLLVAGMALAVRVEEGRVVRVVEKEVEKLVPILQHNNRIAMLWKLKAAFCLFTWISMPSSIKGEQETVSPRIDLEQLRSTLPESDIWWAKPEDAEWSRYSFKKLSGESLEAFRKAFSTARLDEDAGNQYTLEAPMEFQNRHPQGLILLVIERKITAAFVFKYRSVNKRSLERISMIQCDFEKTARYNPGHDGIELDQPIRDLLK